MGCLVVLVCYWEDNGCRWFEFNVWLVEDETGNLVYDLRGCLVVVDELRGCLVDVDELRGCLVDVG